MLAAMSRTANKLGKTHMANQNFAEPRAPTSVDVDLGARIRELRLSRGVTQVDLGDAIGLTFQQVQKYEWGKNRISVGRLFKIAEALKVNVADLLPGHKNYRDTENGRISPEDFRVLRALRSINDEAIREKMIDLIEFVAKKYEL